MLLIRVLYANLPGCSVLCEGGIVADLVVVWVLVRFLDFRGFDWLACGASTLHFFNWSARDASTALHGSSDGSPVSFMAAVS